MLHKNLRCSFQNEVPNLFLINQDGSMEELQMNKYLCLVVFRGAMEPLSSLELIKFSNNISKFQELDCKLVGLARDSPMVLQDWLVEPMMGKEEKVLATFPCISCPSLGAENSGLIQAIRVPLVHGSPIPTIIIMDRHDKVRYFASFSDSTGRSVEETLRMVVAIKMVDDAEGSALAPADWESNQPSITNTKAGVIKYYQEKYKKETLEKGSKGHQGLLAPLKKKLGGFYENLFESSVNPAEAKASAIKGKEAEEYSKYLTRDISNEDANSVGTKDNTLEGANGDGK